jgi:hypothetical protein
LGAVFHAHYKSAIFSLKRLGFGIENCILNFLSKKFLQKMLSNIPFDAKFNSLQNGLLIFDFRRQGQLDSCVGELDVQKRPIFMKINFF